MQSGLKFTSFFAKMSSWKGGTDYGNNRNNRIYCSGWNCYCVCHYQNCKKQKKVAQEGRMNCIIQLCGPQILNRRRDGICTDR